MLTNIDFAFQAKCKKKKESAEQNGTSRLDM